MSQVSFGYIRVVGLNDKGTLALAKDFVYITDNTYTKDELLQMDFCLKRLKRC